MLMRTVACCAVLLLASLATGARVAGDVPWIPTVSADPSHPILTGTVATSIGLPAQRYEILAAVPAQATMAQRDAVAASARNALARVVPDGSFTIGPPVGNDVRIEIDRALTDASLRSTLDAITAAAPIVSVGHGYASCAPFAAAAAVDAESQVQRIATRIGTGDGTGSVLANPGLANDRMDAPPDDAPLCGPDAHRRSRTSLEIPARATFTMRSTYSVEQPMHFNPVRVPPAASQPFLLDGPPASRIQLQLSATSGTLLTLEGFAVAQPAFAGIRYRYAGAFGVHQSTAIAPEALAALRDRLRSAGVANGDITAQRSSDGAAIFVSVRRPDVRDRDEIVRALSFADRRGPDAVTIRPIFAHCSDDAHLVEEAVADAAHRAAQIATLLAATLDLRPIAVQVAPPSSSPCDEHNDLPGTGDLLIPHIAETSPSRDRLMTRTVKVTFELHHPNLNGPVTATNDAPTGWLFRQPITVAIYPGESSSGEADRQSDLTPTDLLLRFDVRPDNAHAFRPLPAALTDRIASDLSLSRSSYGTTPFWNGFAPDGDPVHGLRFVATIPLRGSATTNALSAATHDAADDGYPGLFALPSRRGCERDADDLAIAAIRAAAADAHVRFGSRPLAIDLQGPYVITGTCRNGIGYLLPIGKQPVSIPAITLAARARVSFAAQ